MIAAFVLTAACSRTAAEPDAGDGGHLDGGDPRETTPDASVETDASVEGQPDAGLTPQDAEPLPDAGVAIQPDAGVEEAGGCGLPPGPNDRRWTLEHDGRTRELLVHLPPGYDASTATPLVFDFHGRLFTANLQAGLTHLRDVADSEGFIVVHPEGIGRTWNGGVCCGEAASDDVDDVGFVSAMIDLLSSQLCIDQRRVYATGMSNGAFLSHRLACELSDRIAAIAPVAGVVGVAPCSPARSISVFHFHGTEDDVVQYDGVAGYLSVATSMAGWVERNGCDPESTVYFQQDDVTCEAWSGCDAGVEVRLCTVDGGGHTWPGGTPLPGLGDTTQTIDASELMWTFFLDHPLP